MKNKFSTIILCGVFSFSLFSCSGNKNDDASSETDVQAEEEKAEAASTNVIDPDAKIIEITIQANGNTMADISYDKSEITVPAGCAVRIKFQNNSTDAAMPHNILFIERGSAQAVVDAGMKVGQSGGFKPDLPEVLAGSKLLGPGEIDEFIFMAPAPGEYQYICSFPGHLQAMHGRFFVEE